MKRARLADLVWAVRAWLAANKPTVAFIAVVLIIAAVAPPLIRHGLHKDVAVVCTGSYVATCTVGAR